MSCRFPTGQIRGGWLTVLVLACSSGDNVTAPPPSVHELLILSGDGQRIAAGTEAAPLKVRVTDSEEVGVAGVTVRWSVTAGTATVEPKQSVTDAQGETETVVTASGTAGSVLVSALVEQLPAASFSITVMEPPAPVSALLAVGNRHTCQLVAATIACWGHNDSGQLGDGTSTTRKTPVLVVSDLAFAAVSAGGSHTCALAEDRSAYCWGSNAMGQLGDGTSTDRLSPTLVSGGLTFTLLIAGGSHTCGLTAGFAAYCWGWNSRGQLGDGTTENRFSPVPVSGGLSFATMSVGDAASEAGGEFSCGIAADGTAYCWGRNFSGQLGDGTGVGQLTPVRVAATVPLTTITSGGSHSCALTAGAGALCWGTYGLGNGTQSTELSPASTTGGLTFGSLSAGGHHTCGIAHDGLVSCWGHNESGQLGEGTRIERLSPAALGHGLEFTEVSSGGKHTCGITSTGETRCWGSNEYGQLGDGSVTDRLEPTRVSTIRLCCQPSRSDPLAQLALSCACSVP